MKGQKGQFPYESKVGKAFFLGRAQHEFIQNRMKYCLNEYPVEFSNSYFKLVGHIDLLDIQNNYILELKTTKKHDFIAKSKTDMFICLECGLAKSDSCHRKMDTQIKSYFLQVGAYAKLMEMQTGKYFGASVFIINGTLTEYELTQEDINNSLDIILQRARETYEKLQFLGEIKN